jgi:hypothetical protein
MLNRQGAALNTRQNTYFRDNAYKKEYSVFFVGRLFDGPHGTCIPVFKAIAKGNTNLNAQYYIALQRQWAME